MSLSSSLPLCLNTHNYIDTTAEEEKLRCFWHSSCCCCYWSAVAACAAAGVVDFLRSNSNNNSRASTTLLLPPHSSTIQLSCFCLCGEIEFSPTKRGLRGLCPLPLSLLWSLPAVRQVKITWALICATVDMFVSLSVCLFVCLVFTLCCCHFWSLHTDTKTYAHVSMFVCSHGVWVFSIFVYKA